MKSFKAILPLSLASLALAAPSTRRRITGDASVSLNDGTSGGSTTERRLFGRRIDNGGGDAGSRHTFKFGGNTTKRSKPKRRMRRDDPSQINDNVGCNVFA
jgi:hypothetical protein